VLVALLMCSLKGNDMGYDTSLFILGKLEFIYVVQPRDHFLELTCIVCFVCLQLTDIPLGIGYRLYMRIVNCF
jgi:hypothetical protein